jgi:hypothetical protein
MINSLKDQLRTIRGVISHLDGLLAEAEAERVGDVDLARALVSLEEYAAGLGVVAEDLEATVERNVGAVDVRPV